MKQILVTALLLTGLLLSRPCRSQLIADAGNDTAFCDYKWEQASIGGKPSAYGGTEPYTYAWSTEYHYAGHTFYASFLLEDTTVPNPVFTGPFTDSAKFFLTVTDADQNADMDSVWVRFSQYTICTGDCFHWINPGDSVQLGHCITGGIPPFRHVWTPGESLSDSTSERPWAKPLSNTLYELIYTDSIGCEAYWNCIITVTQSGIKTNDTGKENIQLYPNPTSGLVQISITHPLHINSLLRFFSAEGRLVKEVLISDPFLTIDLSDLGQGIYFYKWIKADEVAGSGKIIHK
ncbi:MAG: T9SS type A sorting domain-containing protein [Bacteroidales bacterium]|nr:T9SS type A sorting domain-containing protein [Bacteroidales bacterium]